MKRLALTALLACALALPATASAGKIPILVVKLHKLVPPPSGPCNDKHIGDIEIIDGVLFECVCEQRVFIEPTCDWYEVTSQADDPTHYKRIRRATRNGKPVAVKPPTTKPPTTTAPRRLVVVLRQVGPT